MTKRQQRSQSGFTLIELSIAVTLMALVMGVIGTMSQRGIALVRTSSANNQVEARATRGLDQVVRSMLSAASTSLAPPLDTPPLAPTTWSATLDFQDAVDWQAGAIVLGAARRVTLQYADGELDNGVDDNGDGRIDECAILVIDNFGLPNQVSHIVASGVREFLAGETQNGLDDNGNGMVDERGFCFSQTGDVLNINLSLEHVGANGEMIVRTHQDSMRLHN